MATAFRRKGSRLVGRLDDQERALVAGILRSTRDLLAPEDEQPATGDPLADLIGGLGRTPATDEEVAARDPALQRLLPPASRDDADQARDFRSMTEDSLRRRKASRLSIAIAALEESPTDRVELDLGQAEALMIALSDVRLVLGERLGLRTDEDSERLHELVESADDDADAAVMAAIVYDMLTWLQETVAQALMR